MYFASFFLPLLSTTMILAVLLKSGIAKKLAIDFPVERSMHSVPTPRIGGIVAIPVAVLWAWSLTGFFPVLTIVTIFLCLVSWVDDRGNLSVWVRLLLHIMAAAILLSRNYHDPESIMLFMVAVIAIAWLINLYNFMDGIDGLAGGMGVIGFAAMGLVILSSNAPHLSILCFSISGSVLGFLIFNFHPARFFLGDAGSISLGLLAGAISVEGVRRNIWPICYPIVIFSPFIADATATLFKRIVARQRFWVAHRDHYYQRMVRLGWGHRRTSLVEYAIMIVASLIGYYLLKFPTAIQWVMCATWYAILALLMFKVDRLWQSRTSA